MNGISEVNRTERCSWKSEDGELWIIHQREYFPGNPGVFTYRVSVANRDDEVPMCAENITLTRAQAEVIHQKLGEFLALP